MNTNIFKQISKFVVVGVINTGIDFAVLNLLTSLTKIYSGKWIVVFNSISFTAAVINSYFMNKRWTFHQSANIARSPADKQELDTKERGQKQTPKEFIQFVVVSVIGISINDIIVYGITTFIAPLFGLSGKLWVNAAKICATGASMIWNFIGYKFFVFKPKKEVNF